MEENSTFDKKSLLTFAGDSARWDWAKIVKHCVAFANARGGCLVFGIEDDSLDAPKNQIIPTNLSPAGRKVILKPTQNTTAMLYPVLIFGLAAGATTVISRWMVEPNAYGPFFNGDSDFGGFVYQNNFADHQWLVNLGD
jgi:hypothetical protein